MEAVKKEKKVKCLVWDLDNTLWDGILTENKDVIIKEDAVKVIKELDKRGILNSIASKNNYEDAMQVLVKSGLDDYFLAPQINWNAKSSSIRNIAEILNINIDTIAFVDDQDFELKEVSYVHPEVMCIKSDKLDEILDLKEMQPLYITKDASMRRQLYKINFKRDDYEKTYQGPQYEFLKSLGMKLFVKYADESDLQRVEELVKRTNQLNSTGCSYEYDELKALLDDPNYRLYIYELEDSFGTYGKIGVMLLECSEVIWKIKLLLFSCRVMSRGIGNGVLVNILNEAHKNKVRLQADFIETGRNKTMYITYKMFGFKEIGQEDKVKFLEYSGEYNRKVPDYITIMSGD